ncbi:SAF domain-containing protein [Spongisporangium articulatum]|uniref:SAF domain-containing protein n=1 Tax=Spongisporangium articulatum TaxID=3362603 RepID=A0ABW8AKY4_9ACTN
MTGARSATGGPAGLSAEPARRLRRPSWRDPRLLAGLLLVLVSVVVGVQVVTGADRTTAVYVARTTLPAGTALTADAVSVARFRLVGGQSRYLLADRALPGGLVVQRTIGAGELVPVAAVGSAASLAVRPVTVPLDDGVPAGVAPGGRVDLWASPTGAATGAQVAAPTGQESTGQESTGQVDQPRPGPRRIAAAVEVFHVTAAGGEGLAAGRAAAVQVLVPENQLTVVLAALAGGQNVAVLPVPGSAP